MVVVFFYICFKKSEKQKKVRLVNALLYVGEPVDITLDGVASNCASLTRTPSPPHPLHLLILATTMHCKIKVKEGEALGMVSERWFARDSHHARTHE